MNLNEALELLVAASTKTGTDILLSLNPGVLNRTKPKMVITEMASGYNIVSNAEVTPETLVSEIESIISKGGGKLAKIAEVKKKMNELNAELAMLEGE